MIQVSVTRLAIDARNAQAVIVLKDQAKLRALSLLIGASEARAISLALEGAKTKRPVAHELLLNVIEDLRYCVKQVEIKGLSSGTYCATIELVPMDQDTAVDQCRLIDARPSDAIALAITSGSPIYISSELMAPCPASADPDNDERRQREFKSFLEGVKASDFKLPGLSVTLPETDTEETTDPQAGQLLNKDDDACSNSDRPELGSP